MFMANQTKQKERLFPTNESRIKSRRCWFSNDVKGQKVAQVTRFENILRNSPFFFGRCVVEMIYLPRSVVPLGETMY